MVLQPAAAMRLAISWVVDNNTFPILLCEHQIWLRGIAGRVILNSSGCEWPGLELSLGAGRVNLVQVEITGATHAPALAVHAGHLELQDSSLMDNFQRALLITGGDVAAVSCSFQRNAGAVRPTIVYEK